MFYSFEILSVSEKDHVNIFQNNFCFTGEKDIKRREAVRRKTAQYLLKAEALYNTYLAGKDSPEKSEQVFSSCFGWQHYLRAMAQVYCSSVRKSMDYCTKQ